MCGITGFVSNIPKPKSVIKDMLETIKHRGPDGSTFEQFGSVFLGHRRLAIIDLDGGNQPMFNHSKELVIVFNGEIYNYKELRKKLIGQGVKFNTNSDTEVILGMFSVYGPDSFVQLNGIFAFVLYDLKQKKIFIVRDHFGIKPMHYYFENGNFIFGSEQKSFLCHPEFIAELNPLALHQQMNLRYNQLDETLFKGIKRLAPASYLVFDVLTNRIEKTEKYFSNIPTINYQLKDDEIYERTAFLLKQAVKRQLVSDVPIGVYLSGGIDSSTIVQKMHQIGHSNINSFTMGFNEPTDEFDEAQLTADMFNTNHHKLSLDLNPLGDMEKVIWHAEEPKINLLQGYNMSAFVSKHVKVVLGGLGGDELFAGYDIHRILNQVNSFKVPKFLEPILQFKSKLLFKLFNSNRFLSIDEYRRGMQIILSITNLEKQYLIIRNVWDFDSDFYKNIYSKQFLNQLKDSHNHQVKNSFTPLFDAVDKLQPLEKILHVEMHSKMINDYLLVEDRMSMANSIEERVPFLDLDLVSFANSIPAYKKIRGKETKFLLRDVMRNSLHDRIINKKKWGFSINPYLQFTKDLKATAEKELTESFIEKQGVFNYSYIKAIIDHKPSPKMRWHYNFLWLLLGQKKWFEVFNVQN